MKEYGFQFAVLRYMHDPITQEFINIGVVLYSPEIQYFKARIGYSLSRASQAFPGMNSEGLLKTLQHLESQITSDPPIPTLFWPCSGQLKDLLQLILPLDDSSLLFGGYGGGLARDLDEQLDFIFDRMVMGYVELGIETVLDFLA